MEARRSEKHPSPAVCMTTAAETSPGRRGPDVPVRGSLCHAAPLTTGPYLPDTALENDP